MLLPSITDPEEGTEFVDVDDVKELEPVVDSDGYVYGVICKYLKTGLIGYSAAPYCDLTGPNFLQAVLNRVKELQADESRANPTTDGAGEGVSDPPHKDSESVRPHSDNSN